MFFNLPQSLDANAIHSFLAIIDDTGPHRFFATIVLFIAFNESLTVATSREPPPGAKCHHNFHVRVTM